MKAAYVLTLAMATGLTALADFSYTSTTKGTGMMAAANSSTKHYLKGQKMMIDSGNTAMIMDFGAETFTSIDNTSKTYTVTKFSDLSQTMKDTGADVKVDVRETGQKKDINGFASREVIMTMETTMDTGRGAPMKSTMEISTWLSSAVPGAGELRAFYQRNASKFPWTAMSGGAGGMAKSMADLRKKMSSMDGVPVLQIVRMQMPGGGMSADQQAKMQKGMADAQKKMEELKNTNPEMAKMMENAMRGRAGAMGGGGGMEITIESTGFSAASIPDSVFAIPAGYTQKSK
jgi:hypothetical protein